MKLGILGGSGLYQMEHLENVEEKRVRTPFGEPSDAFMTGSLEGVDVVFLPRHGRGHFLPPGELNHRANIFAMKTLDVTHILSVSAVGSLKEDIPPRDVVVVDQFVDRTKRGGEHSFFGRGLVAHIAFAHPVCRELAAVAAAAARRSAAGVDGINVHDSGTYLNMEGPAFSTLAESRLYRSWGLDVIGMTNLAEAKLSREAEIHYASLAMVTDYDCWHPDHDQVSVDMIIANLLANAELAKNIVREVAAEIKGLPGECGCDQALKNAIITSPEARDEEMTRRLRPIVGKYLN